MKNTWYLGILVFALAFVGISIGKSTNANQEIILKFTALEVTDGETQDVIHFVKSQLQGVATGQIQIKQSSKGTLKITYYSDIDIAVVKKLLFNTNAFVTQNEGSGSNEQIPFSENSDLARYQLDIFEIQTFKNLKKNSGAVVESKREGVRFFIPEFSTFSSQQIKEKEASTHRAYHAFNTIVLAIDNSCCAVPQVRAGPLT